jgi:hypothetical protein
MTSFLGLLLPLLLVAFWAGTWWRIYTGAYPGRYTRQRWLVSVLTLWGLLAYWAQGDHLRSPRTERRTFQW